MNTNMKGFRWFSINLCFLLWRKVASALEGLNSLRYYQNSKDSFVLWCSRHEWVEDIFGRLVDMNIYFSGP